MTKMLYLSFHIIHLVHHKIKWSNSIFSQFTQYTVQEHISYTVLTFVYEIFCCCNFHKCLILHPTKKGQHLINKTCHMVLKYINEKGSALTQVFPYWSTKWQMVKNVSAFLMHPQASHGYHCSTTSWRIDTNSQYLYRVGSFTKLSLLQSLVDILWITIGDTMSHCWRYYYSGNICTQVLLFSPIKMLLTHLHRCTSW